MRENASGPERTTGRDSRSKPPRPIFDSAGRVSSMLESRSVFSLGYRVAEEACLRGRSNPLFVRPLDLQGGDGTCTGVGSAAAVRTLMTPS